MGYKTTFLFDKSNNWLIERFVRSFVSDTKYEFYFTTESKEIVGNDIVFVIGYTRILDYRFLKANKLALLVHESDLPKGKGFSPVQWQILEGKTTIPICLLEVAQEVDSGKIYLKSTFHISRTDLYPEIREKQGRATVDLIKQFLSSYPNYEKLAQVGEESFYRRRTSLESRLAVDKTIEEQFDLMRIASNEHWPSHFYIRNQKYILKIYKENTTEG